VQGRGCPFVRAAPAAPYGPLLPDHRLRGAVDACPRQVHHQAAGGAGDRQRSVHAAAVHVDDFNGAINYFIERDHWPGEAFDIGGPTAHTMDEIIDILCRIAGKRVLKLHLPKQLFILASHVVKTFHKDLLSTTDCDERADNGRCSRCSVGTTSCRSSRARPACSRGLPRCHAGAGTSTAAGSGAAEPERGQEQPNGEQHQREVPRRKNIGGALLPRTHRTTIPDAAQKADSPGQRCCRIVAVDSEKPARYRRIGGETRRLPLIVALALAACQAGAEVDFVRPKLERIAPLAARLRPARSLELEVALLGQPFWPLGDSDRVRVPPRVVSLTELEPATSGSSTCGCRAPGSR